MSGSYCNAEELIYKYDDLNRLITIQLADKTLINYEYDILNNRKSMAIIVNQPPSISGKPLTIIDEDSQYFFKPTAEDEENDILSFEIENRPDWLIFDVNSGELKGTPDNSNVGTFENIIISVSDDKGNRASLPAFNLTVKNINDAPLLDSELIVNFLSLSEDTDLNSGTTINELIPNDMITDIDEDPVKAIAVTGLDNMNGHWEYSVNDGFSWLNCNDNIDQVVDTHSKAVLLDENSKIRFVPEENFHGNSSFSFCAWDKTSGETGQKVDTTQRGETSPFSVNKANAFIRIIQVNDSPLAEDSTLFVDEDSILISHLQANDIDNDPLVFQIIDQGTKGVITLIDTATGAFTYTPFLDMTGNDLITYKVNDGIVDSNIASLTMTIIPIYDPPVTKHLTFITKENMAIHETLFCDDKDSNVQLFEIVHYPSKGNVVITDLAAGSFTYTPGIFETGMDSFSYKVDDQIAGSNISNVTITIQPVTQKIVGNVNYSGGLSGELYIGAFETDDQDYTNAITEQIHTWESGTNSIDYTLNVDNGKSYYLYAFIDRNYSSKRESDEPAGEYNEEPININNADDIKMRNIIICKKGDVDCDGMITPNDAVEAFNLSFKESFSPDELFRADYDLDGIVAPQDAVDIFYASF